MRSFTNGADEQWVASAREERTPRHHGRWYMIFYPESAPERVLAIPEVRWQTRASAARTLQTMSVFELRRRLEAARARNTRPDGHAPVEDTPDTGRDRAAAPTR